MSTIQITSHDDDSVTLECGSVVAHVRGGCWEEANEAAHRLGRLLRATEDRDDLEAEIQAARIQIRAISAVLRNAETEARQLKLRLFGAATR